jgi:hypothetical protein
VKKEVCEELKAKIEERMTGLAFSVHKFTCDDLPLYVAFALWQDVIFC